MSYTFTVPVDVWASYIQAGRCAVVDDKQPDGFRQIDLAQFDAEVSEDGKDAKVTLTEKE